MNTNPTDRTVVIDYTNYQNKRSMRIINPISLVYGENPFHRQPQWLLTAIDIETGFTRTFAMNDIHSWRKATPNDFV